MYQTNKFILLTISLNFLLEVQAQVITHHNSVSQPNISQPSVGVSVIDPKFNSSVKRLTNSSASSFPGVFPDYSKHQAWNSDESLIMLRNGDGEILFYSGTNYQYLKTFPSSVTGVQDIFWHPTNPQMLYYAFDNTFNQIDEQTDQVTVLHTFPNYSYVTTRAEGNISNDGRYIAMCGYDPNYIPIDFFVYDILLDVITSTMNVSTNVTDFDWISISPLGNFVVVDYADETSARYHGVEVYDRNFNFIWQKPLGAGHSDIGIDNSGAETLVMDVYDADSNVTYIRKMGLADSSVTTLLGLSPEFDMHESCRNTARPGWVYVSTFDYVGRLTDDSLSWLPFEDEVFALKMDGSGDVQRLAHHHSRRFSPTTPNPDSSIYFAEPHATPNRSGTRILFGSNWKQNVELVNSIDVYMCDVSSLITSIENFNAKNQNSTSAFPNPFHTITTLATNTDLKNAHLNIYDASGRKVKTIENIIGRQINVNGDNLSKGIYFYKISQNDKLISSGKLIIE